MLTSDLPELRIIKNRLKMLEIFQLIGCKMFFKVHVFHAHFGQKKGNTSPRSVGLWTNNQEQCNTIGDYAWARYEKINTYMEKQKIFIFELCLWIFNICTLLLIIIFPKKRFRWKNRIVRLILQQMFEECDFL